MKTFGLALTCGVLIGIASTLAPQSPDRVEFNAQARAWAVSLVERAVVAGKQINLANGSVPDTAERRNKEVS